MLERWHKVSSALLFDAFKCGVKHLDKLIPSGGWHPLVLQFLPKSFNQIQFWTVRRDSINAQAFLFPVFHSGVELSAGMDRGVIKNQGRRTPKVTDEVINHVNDGIGRHPTFVKVATHRAVRSLKSKQLEAWVGTAADGHQSSLANWLPAIRHDASKRHRRFIEVDHMLIGRLDKLGDFLFGSAKGFFVASMLRRFAKSLPTQIQTMAVSSQSRPADSLAGRLLQLIEHSTGLVWKLINNFSERLLLFLVQQWFTTGARQIDNPSDSILVELINPTTHCVRMPMKDVSNFTRCVSFFTEQHGMSPPSMRRKRMIAIEVIQLPPLTSSNVCEFGNRPSHQRIIPRLKSLGAAWKASKCRNGSSDGMMQVAYQHYPASPR